jgi:lysyl-tRNA synthetase class II
MQNQSQTSLERFWNERCEISEKATVPKGEAYANYCEFARTIDATPVAINEFAKTLKATPCVKEGRTKRTRFWQGFQLIDKVKASTSKVESPVKEFSHEQDLGSEDELVFEQKSEPSTHISAVDELVKKSLFGVWERRKI